MLYVHFGYAKDCKISAVPWSVSTTVFESSHEKTCIRDFRACPTQTWLYNQGFKFKKADFLITRLINTRTSSIMLTCLCILDHLNTQFQTVKLG